MKKRLALVLIIVGVICVGLWAVGKFLASDWMASYAVNLFGSVGFLLLAYVTLSFANKKMEKTEETSD